MSDQIIQLLVAERDRLEAAIEALQGPATVVDVYDDSTMPDWVRPASKNVAPTPKKKGFSAARRRKMAEGQKRRYAAINAAKAEVAAPKKRTMSAEGRQRIIDATKARWAKVRAAKAEATVAPKSAPAKTPVAPKKKSRTAKSAAFSKKMSDTMKKAWAKRKKAAEKKG